MLSRRAAEGKFFLHTNASRATMSLAADATRPPGAVQ